MQLEPINLSKLADQLEAAYPAIWKCCYTKHIDAPGNYRGSKAIACTFARSYIADLKAPSDALMSNAPIIGLLLEKYDWPQYFVSAPLLEAMLHTHPPEKMTWADIQWPFNAVIFMIPRGLLKDKTGAPIYAIGACIFDAESTDLPHLKQFRTHVTYAQAGVFWLSEPAGTVIQHAAFPASISMEPDPEWINKTTEYVYEMTAEERLGNPRLDGEFCSYISGIAANLLLTMQARPTLIERGHRTGKLLPKSKTAIYSPAFIGRKYTTEIQGPRPDATGHFTELRWVAGHIRKQRIGKGLSDSKLIFIDPFIKRGAGLVRETTG